MNTDYGAGESADDSDGRAEDPARHAGDTGRRAENQPGYADGYREIVDYGCEIPYAEAGPQICRVVASYDQD